MIKSKSKGGTKIRFGDDENTNDSYGESPKLYLTDLKKGEKIRVFHRGTFIEKEIK